MTPEDEGKLIDMITEKCDQVNQKIDQKHEPTDLIAELNMLLKDNSSQVIVIVQTSMSDE